MKSTKWHRNASDEYASSKGCWYDERAAAKAIEFFPSFLCLSKDEWAGKPFELQPWQRDEIVAPLFGWKNADGHRRFRIAYVEIPKKNGKSTLAAGIGLYLTVGDGNEGTHVFSTALDRKQACIVHEEAIVMVKTSPALRDALTINHTTYNIAYPEMRSFYRALASEVGQNEGLDASGLIIDELHAWTGPTGEKRWAELRYAGRSRQNHLRFVITTAGADRESVCWRQHEYAEKVLSGDIQDDRYFAFIRAAKPTDDYKKPEVWRAANPSIGVTFTESEFAKDMEEADKTPADLAAWKRYSLNIWSTSTSPWLPVEMWNACVDIEAMKDLEGRECYGGCDLSKSRDTASFWLVFKISGNEYRCLEWYWLPEETVNAVNAPAVYAAWARNGDLKVTPGAAIEYADIEAKIIELSKIYRIQCIAYDPTFAGASMQRIHNETGIELVEFQQSYRNYADPVEEAERLIRIRGIKHSGHPVTRWQFGNVQIKMGTAGYKMPVKADGQQARKIDGIVSMFMALSQAKNAPVYEFFPVELI